MESGVSYRDPFNYCDRGQSAPPGDQLLDLICDEISEMYPPTFLPLPLISTKKDSRSRDRLPHGLLSYSLLKR